MTNGEGGYSFVNRSRAMAGLIEIHAAVHFGSGQVIIIPAIEVHLWSKFEVISLFRYGFNHVFIYRVAVAITGV